MEPGSVTLQALGQVLTAVGLSSTLILFFVWQAWKREETSNKRSADLDSFIRTTLIEIANKTTAALTENTTASRALVHSMEQMGKQLADHDVFARGAIAQMRENQAQMAANHKQMVENHSQIEKLNQ